MSNCGCSTAQGSAAKGKVLSNNLTWDNGSLGLGATMGVRSIERTLLISELRPPGTIVFRENPYLALGQSIAISNSKDVLSLTGVNQPITVTTVAAQTAAGWEVGTNGAWSGTAWTAPVNQNSSIFCDAGSTVSTAVAVSVCGPKLSLATSTGQVTTRPLNSPVIIGPVLVVNNESAIKVKAGAQFNPRPGDKIELSQTAITGANAATVRAVSSTPSTGGIIKVITLDRPVTGITSTATVNGVPCVDASARPQSIAPITFSQSGCEIFAKIDRSFTSSPNFPPGNRVETGGCDRQSYCYDLSLVFDDGTVLPISGLLVL